MAFARGPKIELDRLKILLDVSNKKCVDNSQPITSTTYLHNLMDKSIRFRPYESDTTGMSFETDGGLKIYKQDGIIGDGINNPCWWSENPIQTQDNYTFSIWFKFSESTLSGETQRAENIYGGGIQSKAVMYLTSGGTSTTHGFLRYDYDGVNDAYSHTQQYGANDGNWHQFTTVDKFSLGSHITEFYIDGVLKNSTTAPLEFTPSGGAVNFTWGSWSGGYGNFTGSTNLFMYWEKALSSEQVLNNFKATKSRFGL